MENEFVPFELDVKLKELGFETKCLGYYCDENNLRGRFVLAYNEKQIDAMVQAPLWQQAFDWFEENHGLSGEVIKQAPYQNVTKSYWWYQIQDSNGEDVSNWQGRFNVILDKSHQEVEGNYVDDNKFLDFLYADFFAFKTRNSAKEKCLEKLIEIVSQC